MANKTRLKELKAMDKRIKRKKKQFERFDQFLKDVQAKYPDEFAELKDIHERYKRL